MMWFPLWLLFGKQWLLFQRRFRCWGAGLRWRVCNTVRRLDNV